MPEGPEIRRAADRVAKVVAGSPLSRVEFAFGRLKPYEDELLGQRVQAEHLPSHVRKPAKIRRHLEKTERGSHRLGGQAGVGHGDLLGLDFARFEDEVDPGVRVIAPPSTCAFPGGRAALP